MKYPTVHAMQYRVLFIVLCTIFTTQLRAQEHTLLPLLTTKDTVTILVTDSGLGGLSVAAGIDSLLRVNKYCKHAEIIFCNALPRANFRYNDLPDAQTKADVFSSVLYKMQERFQPDIILIACNTLSVVYPLTTFAKKESTPVIGIVELGVKAITDSLKQDNRADAIILGTETTIQSCAHKILLIKNGIPEERVYTVPCPNLESEIQTDPGSDMVVNLIDFYLDELPEVSRKDAGHKTFAALCCTHYGFARNVFQNKLQKMFTNPSIINPNEEMIKLFVFPHVPPSNESTVTTTVYSQAVLSEEEINSINKLILPVSVQTGNALKNYTKLNGIFSGN